MSTLPEELQFRSESLEPTICHLMGKWFAQSQYMKNTYGPCSMQYVDSLQSWWWGMQKVSSLLTVCPGAIHAKIAHTNEMHTVKKIIEKELDIKFSFTDGDTVNFRSLVSQLEYSE